MRNKNTIIKWVLVGLMGIVGGLIWFWPDKKLHIIACDVGQGDATLIKHGSTQVLVDGGNSDIVLDCLSQYVPFWDRIIELVILTNADSDHMTGLIGVLENYQVKQVVANNLYKDGERFEVFRDTLASEGAEVFGPKRGDKMKVGKGELMLDVLWPIDRLGDPLVWNGQLENVLGENTYSKTKANEQSVVLKMQYGEFEMLLTGDVGVETEEALINAGVLSDVEVLKVGHHGSRFSSSEQFLEAVEAEVGIISVGKNSYGHPTKEALERLETAGVRVLRTDEQGNIEVVSDGKSYWIK